jgi:hypothetical protein
LGQRGVAAGARGGLGGGQSGRGGGPGAVGRAAQHVEDLRVHRGQARQRGVGAALLGRGGLQQRQGGEDGVVLHRALAQQAVHDARVGLEGRLQLLQARVRQPPGTTTGGQDAGQRGGGAAVPCLVHGGDSGTGWGGAGLV